MRVYLPATLRDLVALLDARQFGPAPVDACAVTGPLASALADERGRPGDEELEFAATEDAAYRSLWRLAAAESEGAQPEPERGAESGSGTVSEWPAGAARRVVLVADVPDDAVRADPARGESAVVVDRAIELRTVHAAHVDDADAERPVAAAVREVAAGGEPDDATAETLTEHQLLWYASQEIPALVGHDPRPVGGAVEDG